LSPNRLIAPLGAHGPAVFETLLLPALAVGLGIWLNPLDPLWVRAAFPWIWLVPLLLALRYGPISGLAGALLLLAAWLGLSTAGRVSGEFPKLFFLGGLIVVMICGEFASIWRARVRRAEAMQIYLDQRLDALTHQHYLLRLSHDRLEQDLISRPVSMRDALGTLRALVGRTFGADPLPGAAALLRLLSQYCQLEQAGLYAASEGRLQGAPAASLGPAFDLDAGDPLVRHAQADRQLSHVQTPGAAEGSRYLIAAPLFDADDRLRGMLVVARLPFFALHDEMLQTLNLLLGYWGDGLDARATAQPLLRARPDCPLDFAFELQRLWNIRAHSGVTSALVVLDFGTRAGRDELAPLVRRQQRSLDVTWLIEEGARQLLVTLLPLSSTAGAEGYLARIEAWLRHQGAESFEFAGVVPRLFLLEDLPPVALLHQVFEICHVSDDARTVGADA
jgi:hypothetical protein